MRFIANGKVESVQHDQLLWTQCDASVTCTSFIGTVDDPTRQRLGALLPRDASIPASASMIAALSFEGHATYTLQMTEPRTGALSLESRPSAGVYNIAWSKDERWMVGTSENWWTPDQPKGATQQLALFDLRTRRVYRIDVARDDAWPEQLTIS